MILVFYHLVYYWLPLTCLLDLDHNILPDQTLPDSYLTPSVRSFYFLALFAWLPYLSLNVYFKAWLCDFRRSKTVFGLCLPCLYTCLAFFLSPSYGNIYCRLRLKSFQFRVISSNKHPGFSWFLLLVYILLSFGGVKEWNVRIFLARPVSLISSISLTFSMSLSFFLHKIPLV